MNPTDEAIAKILGHIETLAPMAWHLAVKAQRVDAVVGIVQDTTIALSVAAATYVVWRTTARHSRSCRDECYMARAFSSVLFLCVMLAVSVSMAGNVAQYFNPEIYAAQAIISGARR